MHFQSSLTGTITCETKGRDWWLRPALCRTVQNHAIKAGPCVVKSSAAERRAIALGRKHAPKGQVTRKKEEKLKAAEPALLSRASHEDFATKFKAIYPEDWNRIVKRFQQHQRIAPPGKSHSMPEPGKYL
jgi:hypothetical protein